VAVVGGGVVPMSGLSDGTRRELLEAWAAWDAKALRVPRRPPGWWLEAETNRHLDALDVAAAEVGWGDSAGFWDALLERRRAGDDHAAALDHVTAQNARDVSGSDGSAWGGEVWS
jgi:hypothetical protein